MSSASTTTAASADVTAAEEPSASAAAAAKAEKAVEAQCYRTKAIQFLGRTTPIILQNDNGPCPLLAICNVLSLRNNLNLSPDIPEVSQEKLLSLVAERLIDSNSNVNNKDAGYVENQQQNIADAIDLLPRLTTGIDVNIKFRRIDDFEFTRECAIFDLLDIPLCHGWIVDPQDHDTANAIGSKSYNTLMGELVSLETQNMENEHVKESEDDCVDFAAATTAALGVPSPCLSRGRSFNDSPMALSEHQIPRKGDVEEAAELLRALRISESDLPALSVDDVLTEEPNSLPNLTASPIVTSPEPIVVPGKAIEGSKENSVSLSGQISFSTLETDNEIFGVQSNLTCEKANALVENESKSSMSSGDVIHVTPGKDGLVENELELSKSSERIPSTCGIPALVSGDGGDEQIQNQSQFLVDATVSSKVQNGCNTLDSLSILTPSADSNSSSSRRHDMDEPEAFSSSIDGSEPIYEGEECILESVTATYQDREPIYEGEVVLAEQVDNGNKDVFGANHKDRITPKQGEVVRNFLKNSASQLTVYGLFCLQEGLRERELCVFFRNNHFNTMFKFEGELYILATDQGYINQPDLVWEKLDEVNGDTVFMTGNFKEFKMESHGNKTWDEQNALASTADYLASIDDSAQENPSFNSDLQLAIALQQQEFEQQQPQRQTNTHQSTVNGGSRLITGPQVPRNTGKHTSSSKQDAKPSKDKCTIM